MQSDGEMQAGTPRWVKVFGAIALVIAVVFVLVLVVVGPGGHGPSRHSREGGTQFATVSEIGDPRPAAHTRQ